MSGEPAGHGGARRSDFWTGVGGRIRADRVTMVAPCPAGYGTRDLHDRHTQPPRGVRADRPLG